MAKIPRYGNMITWWFSQKFGIICNKTQSIYYLAFHSFFLLEWHCDIFLKCHRKYQVWKYLDGPPGIVEAGTAAQLASQGARSPQPPAPNRTASKPLLMGFRILSFDCVFFFFLVSIFVFMCVFGFALSSAAPNRTASKPPDFGFYPWTWTCIFIHFISFTCPVLKWLKSSHDFILGVCIGGCLFICLLRDRIVNMIDSQRVTLDTR